MALVIAQLFPLGRFHATRWNQNPFEDPFGEWPPSPWRLLRAVAARWFQYSRETGDSNESLRNELLATLSSCLPAFRLPELTWRGQAIRQYHPTQVEWSDKSKHKAGYKKSGTTLVLDRYHTLPPDEAVVWIWESLTLADSQAALLKELLRRILYFGRVESFCRFELIEQKHIEPNCLLSKQRGSGSPVLVSMPNPDLKVLLAATDDRLISRRRIPPGTAWYYAPIPACPPIVSQPLRRPMSSKNPKVVQFAVGGRVYPPCSRWVKLIERFRGQVIRICAQQLAGDAKATYGDLPPNDRSRLSLICGKDKHGYPLRENEHAYFSFWPDNNGLPTRLVCWRSTPFTEDEIRALLVASEYAYSWDYGKTDWKLKMVPLPFETPLPPGFCEEAESWVSVTPFVPPANRRRFRSNGRERPGEKPERLVEKLLVKCGYPRPELVELMDGPGERDWLAVHTTRKRRLNGRGERITTTMAGFRIHISFGEPVIGPIALGDSAHFGLGLFAPENSVKD
jgi:CRISPR-associated protein Csb2